MGNCKIKALLNDKILMDICFIKGIFIIAGILSLLYLSSLRAA